MCSRGRRRARTPVTPRSSSEHLQEREGGDVDLLGRIEQRRAHRVGYPIPEVNLLQPLHGRFCRLTSP